MEIVSNKEVERLKALSRLDPIKEIHETTIFNENETIQTIEIIRERSKPTITKITQTPISLEVEFTRKNRKEEKRKWQTEN